MLAGEGVVEGEGSKDFEVCGGISHLHTPPMVIASTWRGVY